MIKAHIIFKKNGKKLEPTKTDKEFADHADMEAFRKQLIESENLSEITFLYTDFNPKLCKCGRQMVFDVVKNKYVCDCN
jgi:hypothetical protein